MSKNLRPLKLLVDAVIGNFFGKMKLIFSAPLPFKKGFRATSFLFEVEPLLIMQC